MHRSSSAPSLAQLATKGKVEYAPNDATAPMPPSHFASRYGDTLIKGYGKPEGHVTDSSLTDLAVRDITASPTPQPFADSPLHRGVEPNSSLLTSSPHGAIQSLMEIVIRPPPPSMLRSQSNESSTPTLPVLEATLVEDSPAGQVYDGIPLRTTDEDVSPGSWKQRGRWIFVGLVLLLVGAMAAILIILLVGARGNNGNETLYYADRENNRCVADDIGTVQRRSYETAEQCCEEEFWHLQGNECLMNSHHIAPPTSSASTSTSSPTPTSTTTETTHGPTSTTESISTQIFSSATSTSPTVSAVDLSQSNWKQQGQAISGDAAHDESGDSVAISSNGRILAIGSPGAFGNHDRPGYAKIYERSETDVLGWRQLGQTIRGKTAGDLFGDSVSLSADGEIVAIGAPGVWKDYDRPGYVGVYRLVKTVGTVPSWKLIGQTITGEAIGDQSGSSISLSKDGKTVAIGANTNEGNGTLSGHVRIYQLIDTPGLEYWAQIGHDIDGEVAGDNSGRAVSLSADGKTLAIGAPNNSGNGVKSGHVRVFHNVDGKNWHQVGEDIDGRAAGVELGDSRSMDLSSDGKTLALGAYGPEAIGEDHVMVFHLDGGFGHGSSWRQLGQTIDGEAPGDQFGISVSLSADARIMAVGANANSSNGIASGQVKVFINVGSNSVEQVGEAIRGQNAADNAGYSNAISADGTTVAIGSHWNSDNGARSGHVRVFRIER